MKKTFICIFAFILLAAASALADTSIQPEAGDYSKAEAIRTATELFLKASGEDEKSLHDFSITAELYESYMATGGETMQRRWEIAFLLTENPYIFYTVFVASPNGAVISTWPNDFALRLSEYRKDLEARVKAVEQGKTLLEEKGPWWFWSYEDKASFVIAYGRNANGDPDTATGLPGKNDIPQDKALSIAKAAIEEHFSPLAHPLNDLKLNAQFLPKWNSKAAGTQGAWILCFHHSILNANGEYPMLYQAVVLSPSGVIEQIYKQDYQGHFDQEPMIYSWPLEATPVSEKEETGITVYYNDEGGKYFHMNAQCPTVKEKYLPLTAIDKSRLSVKPFSYLQPCPQCVK